MTILDVWSDPEQPSMCIEFIKFLNKCFLLQSKYFFKVRFVCEIKLILPKCANIMRTSRKNDVLTMLFS